MYGEPNEVGHKIEVMVGVQDHDLHKKRNKKNLANVYYKTNLPLNKNFQHQKCLFRGRFVLYYRATQIYTNLGLQIPGIKAFFRGLTRLEK